MSHRLQVTVTNDIASELQRRGNRTGQPASRIAARLIDIAISGEFDGGHESPRPTADETPARPSHRPPSWIEPFDSAERLVWRQELWGSVIHLYQRYPWVLVSLDALWFRRAPLVEQLAATAAWRANIDAAAEDPREELAFHRCLEDLKHAINNTQDTSPHVFKPGSAPSEWLRG